MGTFFLCEGDCDERLVHVLFRQWLGGDHLPDLAVDVAIVSGIN